MWVFVTRKAWLFILFVFGYNAPSLGRAPLAKLNDGSEMPRFGLGTWLGFGRKDPFPGEIQNAVEAAIDAGYRLIDTASIYKTEEQVGLAINNKINNGTVKREDIFITTKLWNDAHQQDSVVPALKNSLSNLSLDYVDLYLIHFPFALYNAPSLGRAPLAMLNDGSEMPRFGLGTWLGFDRTDPVKGEVQNAVETAIDAGYRHIDTASIYNTEEQVGLAINNKINDGTVNREDIFITTKLWNDAHQQDSVVPALKNSLSNLSLDYVDLYLIHFPFATYTNDSIQEIDYLETWQGMIEAKMMGLTRSIGVSNFNITQLQRLIDMSGVTPAVLQVQLNLNLQQPELLEFCKTNDITVMAYTPFGSIFYDRASPDAPPPRVDDEKLVNIAKKYNKTVPQIVLRYLFELGVTPIPKSVHKERVEQNIDIFDFELTQEEKNLLKSYDVNYSI